MNNQAPVTALAARERLESIVASGVARASSVIQRVLTEVPTDRVIAAKRFDFAVSPRGGVYLGDGHEQRGVHAHAFGQLTERAGIPAQYARSLAVSDGRDESNQWRRTLLAHAMTEHYQHDTNRYLVRTIGDEVRGVLSDRYRRLDSRPMLDAFVSVATEIGAVPYEGIASDIRTSVRAIVPVIHEPVPGEAMVFGLSWQNSDYGAGTYAISAFVLRLVCLNGLVGENALRQVHLGGRLGENIEFSARTYALDTDTMVSATRDIVRGALGSAQVEKRLAAVKHAHEQEVSFAQAWKAVGTQLTKAEQSAVKDAFESKDVVMLPAGSTKWRFSNALSWVANQAENADRQIDLQRAAGAAIAAV